MQPVPMEGLVEDRGQLLAAGSLPTLQGPVMELMQSVLPLITSPG